MVLQRKRSGLVFTIATVFVTVTLHATENPLRIIADSDTLVPGSANKGVRLLYLARSHPKRGGRWELPQLGIAEQ